MPTKNKSKPVSSLKSSALFQRILKGHFYVLMVLVPLLFWLDTETIFTLPKLAIIQLVSLSAVLVLAFQMHLSGQLSFRWHKLYFFLVVWLVSLIISTVFTLNLHTSLYGQYGRFLGIFTMFNFVLFPVFLVNVFDRKDFSRLFWTAEIIAGLVALFGLLQYFNFFGFWLGNISWTDAPQNRVFSTIGHANHLGGYLAAMLAMLLYSRPIRDKKLPHVIFSTLLGILLFVVLILTASRGALLALLICIVVISILKLVMNWSKLRSRYTKIIAAVILGLTVLIGLVYFSWSSLETLGLLRRTEMTVETINKGKIPDRLSFLYSALEMFKDHPLSGTGLSTFRDTYNQYRRADYYIDGPGNAQYITTPEAAHNEYANILATQGIIGLLAYLALLFMVIRILGKNYFRQPDSGIHLSILAGLLVFLVQTIFNFGEMVNFSLFYSLLGFAMLSDQPAALKTVKIKINGLLKIFITLLVLFGVLTVLFYYWWPEIQTDYFYRRAENAQTLNRPGQAQTNWQNSILADPGEYLLYQSLADFQLQAGIMSTNRNDRENYLKNAAQNYLEALSLNPNYPSTFHNLALTYLELYHSTKLPAFLDLSKEYYQKSVDKSPNNPRYLYEFARKLHSEWNDRVGAVKLLKQALQIAPDYQEPQDYLNFLYKNHPELQNLPQ